MLNLKLCRKHKFYANKNLADYKCPYPSPLKSLTDLEKILCDYPFVFPFLLVAYCSVESGHHCGEHEDSLHAAGEVPKF